VRVSVEEEARLEVVRRNFDAWNRRDLDELIALSDAEIEYVNAPDAVEPGTRLGIDELARVARAQWDALGDARMAIEALYSVGDDVLAIARMSRSMPGSDIRLEGRFAARFTVRDGKMTRMEALGGDVDAVLAAAGLGAARGST
jgi:ketosteroid isomerase-like protein